MPEEVSKITPREYGQKVGISPQLIYYHIRVGNITSSFCECGRKVIDIEEADKWFKKETK